MCCTSSSCIFTRLKHSRKTAENAVETSWIKLPLIWVETRELLMQQNIVTKNVFQDLHEASLLSSFVNVPSSETHIVTLKCISPAPWLE